MSKIGKVCRALLASVAFVSLSAFAEFVPADRQLDGVTLPEGYTLLSAVSSTGEQYVDLEVTPDETAAYEITMRVDDVNPLDDTFILGARTAYLTKALYFSTVANDRWAWYLANGRLESVSRSGFNVVTFTPQRRIYVNNQYMSQMDAGEVVTDKNLYLFTVNNNGEPHKNCSKISVRRIKIWKGGLLVRDCVGAMNSSEVIGLYDLASGRFFGSKTEVGLKVGDPDYAPQAAHDLLKDVRLPEGYELLDYVSSTGEQYFDTEIVPDETVTFDLAFRNHETTEDTHLFGSRLAYEDNAVGFSIQKTTMRTHFSDTHLDYGDEDGGGDVIFRTVALTASHAVYVDGARGKTPLSPTVSTIVNPNPIYIFSCNDNGKPHNQYSSIDLRNCRIWKGGELVRNYVPARHGVRSGFMILSARVSNRRIPRLPSSPGRRSPRTMCRRRSSSSVSVCRATTCS